MDTKIVRYKCKVFILHNTFDPIHSLGLVLDRSPGRTVCCLNISKHTNMHAQEAFSASGCENS